MSKLWVSRHGRMGLPRVEKNWTSIARVGRRRLRRKTNDCDCFRHFERDFETCAFKARITFNPCQIRSRGELLLVSVQNFNNNEEIHSGPIELVKNYLSNDRVYIQSAGQLKYQRLFKCRLSAVSIYKTAVDIFRRVPRSPPEDV